MNLFLISIMIYLASPGVNRFVWELVSIKQGIELVVWVTTLYSGQQRPVWVL